MPSLGLIVLLRGFPGDLGTEPMEDSVKLPLLNGDVILGSCGILKDGRSKLSMMALNLEFVIFLTSRNRSSSP